MAERILVLEGPKGTAIQSLELSEEDFRGDLLKDHPRDIRGDNDVLGLTRPDIVEAIHRDYLAAGAWILSTNTFNASPVSQAEYGLEHLVYDMNRAAAENARRALDGAEDRFVVGSVGPTNRTLSISPKVEDPAYRTITFDKLTEAYAEQIRGLVDGGVDVLQIETIFDTLNAKAAVAAAQRRRPGRAALALLHGGRPERQEPLGADRGGVLALDRARGAPDRRGQLLARAPRRCAPTSRRSLGSPPPTRRATPTPDSPTRSACTTRTPRSPAPMSGSSRARDWPTSSAGAAGPRRSTSGRSPRRSRTFLPGRSPTPTRRSPRSAASSRSSSAPTRAS